MLSLGELTMENENWRARKVIRSTGIHYREVIGSGRKDDIVVTSVSSCS
jgi:hypothetical protein